MNHGTTVTDTARGRHPLPPTFALCAPAAWQIREEGEYYIPRVPGDDLPEGEDYDANPALTDAANAHTRNARDAQRELEDAVSLVGVLLDAVEQDSDVRAAQTRTVLEFAVDCLHNAHHLIDEQERQDRNLCLAFSGLKGEGEEERENVAPPFDG